MCSCISPNVNCLWLVGVTLIFDGTPQKIVQRCQITTPRWPNDISSAADNAKNGPIMPLDQSPHQTVSRCGCKVECNSKTSYQHGFQKLCSTSHYFLELTSEVNERFINGQQTETSVNHLIESTMIFCFINYFTWVFSNNAVRWLKSYLSSRTQQVKFENALSKIIDVPSRVPQGSHLLLLILIYSYIPIM